MAAAAILAHRMTPGQAQTSNAIQSMDNSSTNPSASSSSTGSSSSSAADSATISANDFLTLLVTEMQNQDPTSETDPNEYVNQLVQVNSLEQLISINQTLTTSLDPSGSTANADTAGGKATAESVNQTGESRQTGAAALHKSGASAAPAQAPGNLGIPAANPAAERVGHALNGQAANNDSQRVVAGHPRLKAIVRHFPTAI